MKKTLSLLILTLAFAGMALAAVVRPAPDFSWQGVGKHTLKGLRGQPVVIIVARSARDGSFRKQAKRLKEIYNEFATREVVFVAAFTKEQGNIPSDVPFVVANDGAQVAADYQVEGNFGVFVVGRDGNLDLATSKVVPASRIRDVINNSFTVQTDHRAKAN